MQDYKDLFKIVNIFIRAKRIPRLGHDSAIIVNVDTEYLNFASDISFDKPYILDLKTILSEHIHNFEYTDKFGDIFNIKIDIDGIIDIINQITEFQFESFIFLNTISNNISSHIIAKNMNIANCNEDRFIIVLKYNGIGSWQFSPTLLRYIGNEVNFSNNKEIYLNDMIIFDVYESRQDITTAYEFLYNQLQKAGPITNCLQLIVDIYNTFPYKSDNAIESQIALSDYLTLDSD